VETSYLKAVESPVALHAEEQCSPYIDNALPLPIIRMTVMLTPLIVAASSHANTLRL
jgi:hypothetical protein